MAKPGGEQEQSTEVRILELAFPDDQAPPQLSVGIVSLVELCDLAMPDPQALIHRLREEAKFEAFPQDRANELGNMLALDNKVFSFPVRKLKHSLFVRDRHEALVHILVTEGESDQGKVVFCSAIFNGALEADAVKAAVHVTKRQPITGATVTNAGGATLRRVFWDVEGASGIRGFMVTGPKDVEAINQLRAFTAFNLVQAK